MADTWYSDDEPAIPRRRFGGWVRVTLRAVPLLVLIGGGLLVLLALRLIERPLFGQQRPITPYITQTVCRGAFVILGIRFRTTGTPMAQAGAIVSNHISWLDIFALNARKRIYFVAKTEVATWLGIGWLARATGTVFIRRDRSDIANQIGIFRNRLLAGDRLLFFPEGTSTDGLQVLAFKPALFAAFFDPSLSDQTMLQAVTVNYSAPVGADPRFYGWWGTMDFTPHLVTVLAARRQGTVHVVYHTPVRVSDFADRKALAQAMEHKVRAGLAQHRGT